MFELKKIQLKNYRQHKDVEKEFTGSLIAIVGRNGAGKSNFIGSIQFALTGEQPGYNKKDLITWGEKDGCVDLYFSHSGHDCHIKRYIATPTCSLTIDKERINGAKAVEAALRDRFGVDKELFKQVVFVRQAEIDAILFDEPRKREIAFQRLAGLGDTEKMYNVLGGILTKYDHPENYDQFLHDAETNLAATKERCEQLKTKIASMREVLAQMPDKESMMNLLSQTQAEIAETKRRLEDAKMMEDYKVRLEAAKKKLEAINAGPHNEKTMEAMVAEHEKLKAALEQVENYNNTVASIQKYRGTLQVLNSEVLEDADAILEREEAYNKSREKLAAFANRLLTLDGYKKIVGESGNCPVCGSSLTFNLQEKLESEIADIKKEAEDVKAAMPVNNFDILRRSLSEHKIRVATTESKIDSLESEKAAIEARYQAIASSDVSKGKAMVAASEKAILEKKQWEALKTTTEREIAVCESGIARCKASVGDLDLEDSLTIRLDENVRQASDLTMGIQKYDQVFSEISALDGAITSTEEQIKASEAYIADLKVKKDGSEELRKRINVLETVRQALHYTALPRALSQRIVSKLTTGVNAYLELFSAPFTVEPSNDGVGFLCQFTDGRQMPDELPDATFLSGGQKVQLAVAFRFATYELFASKLGLLVLDEPTAYLDEATINKFGNVLKKIMDVAKTMNVQVLCATHHDQVSAQADQTIAF